MKRYDPYFDAYKLSQWMEPQEKGYYVLYEEAAALIQEHMRTIAEKDKEISLLREKVRLSDGRLHDVAVHCENVE